MNEPVIYQKSPIAVDLKAGQSYAWCACGRSAKQPFCDGSHKDTGMTPVVFKAEETKTAHLCACKQTAGAPNCDGSHKKL